MKKMSLSTKILIGPKVLIPMAKVIIAFYLGCALHGGIVYFLSVKYLGNFSPIRFWKGFMPAMVVAFTTCSSSATLPVSMKCTQENMGVSKEVASFVQPLGATINMTAPLSTRVSVPSLWLRSLGLI